MGLVNQSLVPSEKSLKFKLFKIWASESHGACLFQEVSLVTYELLCGRVEEEERMPSRPSASILEAK